MTFDYDVAVIGGGPAGISAAINLNLKGKSAAICSNNYAESALYKAKRVDNFPGLPGVSELSFWTAWPSMYLRSV
jgi:thioredoxin reductase (NADPH)